jgi:hypothetical protein
MECKGVSNIDGGCVFLMATGDGVPNSDGGRSNRRWGSE